MSICDKIMSSELSVIEPRSRWTGSPPHDGYNQRLVWESYGVLTRCRYSVLQSTHPAWRDFVLRPSSHSWGWPQTPESSASTTRTLRFQVGITMNSSHWKVPLGGGSLSKCYIRSFQTGGSFWWPRRVQRADQEQGSTMEKLIGGVLLSFNCQLDIA